MFIADVRASTFVVALAFVAVALVRGDRRPLAACFAWLLGFEVAFEVTSLAVGRPGPLGALHVYFYVVLGVVFLPWLTRRGIRPNLPLFVAALAVFAVWVATGFHVNQHTLVGLDPTAEVLNEAAKTLWALAYLLPLCRFERSTVSA